MHSQLAAMRTMMAQLVPDEGDGGNVDDTAMLGGAAGGADDLYDGGDEEDDEDDDLKDTSMLEAYMEAHMEEMAPEEAAEVREKLERLRQMEAELGKLRGMIAENETAMVEAQVQEGGDGKKQESPADQDHRIGQGGFDLLAQITRFFQVLGGDLKDQSERAGILPYSD